jgi:hypothetical protein
MRTLLALSCLTIVLVAGVRSVYAGEADPREVEFLQATQEEGTINEEGTIKTGLQEQGLVPDRGHESVLRGTFQQSNPLGGQRKDVIGTFWVTEVLVGSIAPPVGSAFMVKVLDPGGGDKEVERRLESFDNKTVTLGGKIRNKSDEYPQGQFFIVGEVMTQTGGTVLLTKTYTAPGRL